MDITIPVARVYTIRAVTPNITRVMAFTTPASIIPGMEASITPGTGASIIPGMEASITPGMEASIILGTGASITPGMEEAADTDIRVTWLSYQSRKGES